MHGHVHRHVNAHRRENIHIVLRCRASRQTCEHPILINPTRTILSAVPASRGHRQHLKQTFRTFIHFLNSKFIIKYLGVNRV